MKNLLSENMIRFGTKNLTEAGKTELILKSILETIDQHGLTSEIRKALMEQRGTPWTSKMGDPSWLNIPAGSAAGGDIKSGFPDGTSYVQQFSHAGANVGIHGDDNVVLLPTGTQWTLSPSKHFLLAKGMKVITPNFGYGANGKLTGLQDGMYITKVAQGKGVGTDNQPVKVTSVPVAITPGVGGVFVSGIDTALNLRWPNDNLFKTIQKLGYLG
jgi:hypothetical protein